MPHVRSLKKCVRCDTRAAAATVAARCRRPVLPLIHHFSTLTFCSRTADCAPLEAHLPIGRNQRCEQPRRHTRTLVRPRPIPTVFRASSVKSGNRCRRPRVKPQRVVRSPMNPAICAFHASRHAVCSQPVHQPPCRDCHVPSAVIQKSCAFWLANQWLGLRDGQNGRR